MLGGSLTRLAAAVSLTLALSACGYEHLGSTETPTTPAPTQPGASPTLPTPPNASVQDNRLGASAYMGYFVDLVNYTAMTGDPVDLRIQVARCDDCLDWLEDLVNSPRAERDIWALRSVRFTGEDETRLTVRIETVDGDANPLEPMRVRLNDRPPYLIEDIEPLP